MALVVLLGVAYAGVLSHMNLYAPEPYMVSHISVFPAYPCDSLGLSYRGMRTLTDDVALAVTLARMRSSTSHKHKSIAPDALVRYLGWCLSRVAVR